MVNISILLYAGELIYTVSAVWVNIKPGNSRMANYLKSVGKARSSYYGGVDVWVSEFGQSMARKEDYGRAYASVLRENGVDRCYMMSRID